ncbi:hypothetical protein NX059_003901 [Plenodomus lindquistii]|nr:hypothetical protein NX059_003901 [Plenodomus lindquistii]
MLTEGWREANTATNLSKSLLMLDRFFASTAAVFSFIGKASQISANIPQRRDNLQQKPRLSRGIAKPSDRKEFLESLLQAHADDPQLVDQRQVLSYTESNVFVGGDTTAISLRSILYYMLKNPHVMDKVLAEIDAVVGDRDCDLKPVSFAESNSMPYFQAVMKEAMRVHPAVDLLLERVVPAGGVQIAGHHLPAGTVFGAGTRTCIGKHISQLEMSKIVPQLLWKFEFQLAYPEKEWSLENKFFVKQSEFHVYTTERQRS